MWFQLFHHHQQIIIALDTWQRYKYLQNCLYKIWAPNRFQEEVVEPLSAAANLKGCDGIVELLISILNVNHAIN